MTTIIITGKNNTAVCNLALNIARSQKVAYNIVGVGKVLPTITPGVNYIFTTQDLSVFPLALQQTSVLLHRPLVCI